MMEWNGEIVEDKSLYPGKIRKLYSGGKLNKSVMNDIMWQIDRISRVCVYGKEDLDKPFKELSKEEQERIRNKFAKLLNMEHMSVFEHIPITVHFESKRKTESDEHYGLRLYSYELVNLFLSKDPNFFTYIKFSQNTNLFHNLKKSGKRKVMFKTNLRAVLELYWRSFHIYDNNDICIPGEFDTFNLLSKSSYRAIGEDIYVSLLNVLNELATFAHEIYRNIANSEKCSDEHFYTIWEDKILYELNGFQCANNENLSSDISIDVDYTDFKTFRIEATRSALAEITRHRNFSFTVESTRYNDYSENLKTYVENPNLDDAVKHLEMHTEFEKFESIVQKHYKKLMKITKDKDTAREVLPNSLRVSMYMSMNTETRPYYNFIKLRTSENAHRLIRRIAYGIKNIVEGK